MNVTPALAVAALAALATGCTTSTLESNSSWNADSLGRRMTYQATGYEGAEEESFKEFQYREKRELDLSLSRHFLNRNPENPFQPWDPDYGRERPPHSVWPDPWMYFHWESLATGFVTLAASGGSLFLPIPINSMIGTLFEEDGFEEFGEGFTSYEARRVSRHTRRVPPSPDEFEVKNPDGPRRRIGN